MNRRRRGRLFLSMILFPGMILPPKVAPAGLFPAHKGPEEGPITLKQAAAYVDEIDKKLFAAGTIGVKAPDVWGQNRMTSYRAEYESQMAGQLTKFQNILQAAQSRADIAALTSATSLGATLAAKSGGGAATKAAPVASSTTVTSAPSTSTAAPASTSTGPGNPDFTDMAAQLKAIGDRIDALKTGALALPTNINTFNNGTGQTGVGLEPTVVLDEQSNYLNHLHQLRRVNAGDDLTDMAGYGLYLLRMPVSLLPGPESRKGKGASVTVEARHDLTDDLLANTWRDVTILDVTYAMTQVVNDEIHQDLFCNGASTGTSQAATRAGRPLESSKNMVGANPTYLNDLRIILGPLDPAMPAPASPAPAAVAPSATPMTPRPTPAEPVNRPRQNPTKPLRNSAESYARRGVPTPAPPALAGRATAGRPKDDRLIRTQGTALAPLPTFPSGPVVTAAPTLPGYRTVMSDRLDQITMAIEDSQEDPYRHDPSTLSLLQSSLLEAYKFMRDNVGKTDLFQGPRIERLGELLIRKDFPNLLIEREQFLKELVYFRVNPAPVVTDADWSVYVTPTDILCFCLLLQDVIVDRQLKEDMKTMAQRRGCVCGEVDGLCFYDFYPTQEARDAFKAYVACKWPLHVYSVDPVLEQQNVLDAYSRRTELQLALAVAVASGQFNIKNATSFARQLDLDLQAVGLNRTSVGFGAGETTFGWMFYPRVQTPQPTSNFRTFTNTLTGTGQGINSDLRSRRIEPGQRECLALMVTPNFIPALKVSTVTNWFDVTGHHARQQLDNREMINLSRKLQQAKAALARACDSGQYRATDFIVLNQRIKQLEALLPTQDTRIDLPDEGDLLGSEIFSSNAAGLGPSLLAWYGEPVQEGAAGSIFLQGRGFSVTETQVVVGGVALAKDTQFRLVSRNVMQIMVPANARTSKFVCEPGDATAGGPADCVQAATGQAAGLAKAKPKPIAVAAIKDPRIPQVSVSGNAAEVSIDGNKVHAELDPKLGSDINVSVGDGTTSTVAQGSKVDIRVGGVRAHAEAAPVAVPKDNSRSVIDVHIATPNGISNHLYVEVTPKPQAPAPTPLATTATTTTVVNGNTTTTTTRFETTALGIALPPLTVLPMGSPLPQTTILAPGPVTGSAAGTVFPGLVPQATPAATPAATFAPAATTPPATTTTPPATTTTTPAATTTTTGVAPAAPVAPALVGPIESPPGFSLPPLPDAPAATKLSDLGPRSAATASPGRVRPTVLRRIGLPDR